MAETTNKSWRYGVESGEQGVGYSENTGDDWVKPESETFGVPVFDQYGMAHQLVWDAYTGKPYDISCREGTDGGSVTLCWKDKSATGADGTDIAWSILFGEDRGEHEHFYVEHLEGHIYTRPYNESSGYPTGLEFTEALYEDGNPTTPVATAADVNYNGDISYDMYDSGAHRLQVKLSGNMAPCIVVGRQDYYKVSDRAADPDNTSSTEMGYQVTLANVIMWPDLINGMLKNRYDGEAISGQIYTAVADAIGNTQGIRISSALTLPSVTMMGGGAILLWYSGVIALTIGGVAVALTDHGPTAVGGYKLAYANTINHTGAVVITPTGNANLFDMRFYNAAVSTAARTYLYNDAGVNSGKVTIPS